MATTIFDIINSGVKNLYNVISGDNPFKIVLVRCGGYYVTFGTDAIDVKMALKDDVNWFDFDMQVSLIEEKRLGELLPKLVRNSGYKVVIA